MFTEVRVNSKAFHLAIIQPSYQDLVPGTGNFDSTLPLWTHMPNVPSKAPIINIKRVQNIMQRRDASCDLIYKKLFNATVRQITTDELYAATKTCRNEFYQGALKDWRNDDPLFGNKTQPYFRSAFRTDMVTNGYFGDISRITTGTEKFSTTSYDGVWKWLTEYTAAGVIPASQTMAAPNVDLRTNPAQAFAIIDGLYNKQPADLRAEPAGNKMYLVSAPVWDGFMTYLRNTSQADLVQIVAAYANGVKVYSYNGIEIYVDPLWEAVLLELNPTKFPNAAILTVKGNFVFADDDDYGEGPDGKSALVIWYEWKEMSWYYNAFAKAGTNVALPEWVCYCI